MVAIGSSTAVGLARSDAAALGTRHSDVIPSPYSGIGSDCGVHELSAHAAGCPAPFEAKVEIAGGQEEVSVRV